MQFTAVSAGIPSLQERGKRSTLANPSPQGVENNKFLDHHLPSSFLSPRAKKRDKNFYLTNPLTFYFPYFFSPPPFLSIPPRGDGVCSGRVRQEEEKERRGVEDGGAVGIRGRRKPYPSSLLKTIEASAFSPSFLSLFFFFHRPRPRRRESLGRRNRGKRRRRAGKGELGLTPFFLSSFRQLQ